MRYRDAMTGRVVSRSTGTTKRKEAEKRAAQWEAELREGRYHAPSKVLWAEFRERYEAEALTALAPAMRRKANGILDRVEEVLNPVKLADITAARLSYYGVEVRKAGTSDVTLAAHYRHLLAALGWACRMGMLVKVPAVEFPKRAKGSKLMKGRPIVLEEFERLLDKAPAIVGVEAAPSWRHYLTGLWLSGLRLAESLELWWEGDGRDDRLAVDLTGEYPMLRIPAGLEKGNQDRLLPMAPEFAEFLLATPEDQRVGRVFNPRTPRRAKGQRLCDRAVSGIITRIGEAAGVKVSEASETGKVKFASAHDLRRSFGARWATRVMPPVLMELMRHESIETTLRYYIGRNAQSTAKTLWTAYRLAQEGNSFGNTQPERAENPGGF